MQKHKTARVFSPRAGNNVPFIQCDKEGMEAEGRGLVLPAPSEVWVQMCENNISKSSFPCVNDLVILHSIVKFFVKSV